MEYRTAHAYGADSFSDFNTGICTALRVDPAAARGGALGHSRYVAIGIRPVTFCWPGWGRLAAC